MLALGEREGHTRGIGGVGDNPELDTGKEEDDVGDTEEETLGATSQQGATTDIGTSTGDVSTTAPTAETGSKFDMMPPDPGDCGAATLEACEANPDCMPIFGESELSDDCKPDPQFLGCLPQQPCDTVLLTVCDEETNESFRLSNGCGRRGVHVYQDGQRRLPRWTATRTATCRARSWRPSSRRCCCRCRHILRAPR